MKIVRFPDETLQMRSNELIDKVTNVTESIIEKMFRTMTMWHGIGLSAIQVGYPFRVFVMDASELGSKIGKQVFVNPEILESSSEIQSFQEGCLSFPGIIASVKRPAKIKIKARDIKFNEFELELDGIDAICFQHELDHLDGITIYDRTGPLKRDQIKKKLGVPSKRARLAQR